MKIHHPVRTFSSTALAALIMLSATAVSAQTDRDKREDKSRIKQEQKDDRRTSQPPVYQRDDRQRTTQPKVYQRDERTRPTEPRVIQRDERERRVPTTPPPRNYVLDKRYDHNRYYPPTGYRLPRLPTGYRVLHYHDRPYYYYGGIWYLYTGVYFTVTMPPIGITVPILPPYYTTIWIGGVPYYYANGVYYIWQPVQRVYVVTDPPPASSVSEEPTEPAKLFIYPRKGQSAEQQAKDRYECHAWAAKESGFDPTRAGGGVPVEQYVSKRDDYHRAMKACLEARGYSVK